MTTILIRTLTAATLLCAATTVAAQTIGLVQINEEAQFFQEMNRGAREAAGAHGAELMVFDADNLMWKQDNAIKTAIREDMDALLVVAIDVHRIMPAVTRATEAGIVVVGVDAVLPEGPQVAQVGVDNHGAGQRIGQVFLDHVDREMGGSARVGIVGALNSTIQTARQRGFVDMVGQHEGIDFVGVVDGRNAQDSAQAAAGSLFAANPGMDAVYATGEPALIGTVAAVRAQELEDRVKVFGWDLTQESIAGIDDDFVVAVVQQSPHGIGEAAVEAALTAIKGGEVAPVIDVPVTIVTEENVDQFR